MDLVQVGARGERNGSRVLRLVGCLVAASVAWGLVCVPSGASALVNNRVGARCTKAGEAVREIKTQAYLTCMKNLQGRLVWTPPLGRSAVDRPGANKWDVKFVYLTFKNGPDAKRDSLGDIAVMADQVGSYFRSQNPGKQIRFDTFKGQLDVQHIAAPLTNTEFRKLWPPPTRTSDGCPDPNVVCRSNFKYPDFLEQVLNSKGLVWSHNHGVVNAYGQNERLYVLVVEGFRGKKCGSDTDCVEYECGPGDISWDGIVVKFMLKNNLSQCEATQALWGQRAGQPVDFLWWGIEIVRNMVHSMTALPGCGKEVQEYIDMPYQERPYVKGSPYDIWGQNGDWWKLYKWPKLPQLDVDRKYYFKIANGPRVGNKCWDIQYSPYWMRS